LRPRQIQTRAISGLGGEFVKGYYRLLYNAFGFLTAGVAVYLILQIPDVPLWSAPPWLRWPMHGMELLGAYVGIRAFRIFDVREFLGVKQASRHVRGKKVEGDAEGIRINRLVTTGVYGLTRNPMYLGGILIFSFWPYVTRNRLAVCALADAYFVFGALVEERRMLKRFGLEYRRYKEEVPLLLPRPRATAREIKASLFRQKPPFFRPCALISTHSIGRRPVFLSLLFSFSIMLMQ
jgi:protein-S-isoprenylcysteine O-methyltransferase Ste14